LLPKGSKKVRILVISSGKLLQENLDGNSVKTGDLMIGYAQ
jgi:hypothetical protein